MGGPAMIRIGEVHCLGCGDAFEPEGLPNFDEPNFCSDECEVSYAREQDDRLNDTAYWEARYGGASVF